MALTQDRVDETFSVRLRRAGEVHNWDDTRLIKRILKEGLGVDVSHAEAADFWRWRSNQWDASWLYVYDDSSKEVVDFFERFVESVMGDDEEIPVEIPVTNLGRKIVARDADGCLWELLLKEEFAQELEEGVFSEGLSVPFDHPGILHYHKVENEGLERHRTHVSRYSQSGFNLAFFLHITSINNVEVLRYKSTSWRYV